MPLQPLYLDKSFTTVISSQQCTEFSDRLYRILEGYFAQMPTSEHCCFIVKPGAMNTIGGVVNSVGSAVSLPVISHILHAVGAGLGSADAQRNQRLGEILRQKMGGDDFEVVKKNINQVIQRLTRQYQTQLEQLDKALEGRNPERPIHHMVDLSEQLKDCAGLAVDALLGNKANVSDPQLVAEFAAARIIEYMESHCDEKLSSPFLIVPFNPNRPVSILNALYVTIYQNCLQYQLLHPNGHIIRDEITQDELGYPLNESVLISELNNHAMPKIMAVMGERGHISPMNTMSAPTTCWSPFELVAAVQGFHGLTASVNRRIYGKLTVIVNQQGQKKAWLITDIFSRPGLCVENPLMLTKTYYHDDAAGRTNTKDYGYRLSTQEEATYSRYPVTQKIHYAPSFIRDYTVAQPHASHLVESEASLKQKQDSLNTHFTRVTKTLDAQEELFQHVLELNSAYSNQSHTEVLLQLIKDNYFLFLHKAKDILNAEPKFAILVYTQMALSFTTLNDTHTAWAFYCTAAALIEPTSPFKNELQLGRLRCEYQNAVQYIQLLGQSFQQQLALESFKTRITTVLTIGDEQRLLIETAPLWKAHMPDGLDAIKEYYTFSPNQPRVTQWLANSITQMLHLYKCDPDQGLDIGTRLASAYLRIGRMRTVNDIYQSLEPMLSARFNLYMTQLEDAQRSNNISAFNDITSRLCRPLLQRYQGHQQWERGRTLIYAVAQKAKRFETFELALLTSGTAFTINGVREVETPDTLLREIQMGASLPLDACIQSIKQAPTVRDKELAWLKLLQEVLKRQVDYLGEPPCAFSFLYLKPFKTPSSEDLTFRLLLEKSVTTLMPMEMMYFNTLLTAVRDIIDNVEGKWSIKNINNKDQLVREGMHIDRRCYIQEPHVQWSTSHVHTPIELMNTMVEQWGKDKLHPDAIVTPVSMYTSDNGASLLNDYASDFFAHHPALYITSQCIDTVPSPLTIQNQNGIFYLSPFITSALLNQARTALRPKTTGQAGNHTVLPIWIKSKSNSNSSPDYYVKLWPEHPGRSYACARLAQRLFGGGVVSSVSHLLTYLAPNGTSKQLCAEFIETAKGRSLFDWLYPTDIVTKRLQPEVQEQNLTTLTCLGAAEFTKHFLLSICFHLEDESPKNIFFDAETQTLTKIDVERAFLNQIKKPKNSGTNNKGLTIKSILFCMDNMLDYLDEETLRRFINLDMFHEIELWLRDLEQENTRHKHILMQYIAMLYQPYISGLFGRKIANIDSSLLGVVFPDSLLPDLLERLLAVQNELRLSLSHHEHLTGLDLLRCVSANVYSYYKPLYDEKRWPQHKNQHALARFNYVTDGLYRGNTLISLKTSVEIEGEYQAGEIANILNGIQDSPTNARQSLEQYKNVTEEAALRALKEGRPFLFRWLQSDKQAAVLQQLIDRPETTSLSVDVQRAILNTLAIFPLRSLTLTPFAAVLNNDMLQRVIQDTGHHVQNLNVTNCHLLTQESIYIIAEYCPNLQILDLSGIKNLVEIANKPGTLGLGGQQLQFSYCKTLILNGCNIKQIVCPDASQFRALRHLEIKECEALERAEINTASILAIDGLDSCLKLLGRAALSQYPWLIGLSLSSGLTEEEYQQTAKFITDALTNTRQVQRPSLKAKQEVLGYFNQLYHNLNRFISDALEKLNSVRVLKSYVDAHEFMEVLCQVAKMRAELLIPVLLKQLQESSKNNSLIPCYAARALEMLDRIEPQIITALLTKLNNEIENGEDKYGIRTDICCVIVHVLSRLNSNDPRIIAVLLAVLRNTVSVSSKLRCAAATALTNLRFNNAGVVSVLLENLDDEDASVREASITALSKLKSSDARIIPGLLQKIHDLASSKETKLPIRGTLATALAEFGSADFRIIPALLQIVGKSHVPSEPDYIFGWGAAGIREPIAEAFAKLGVSDPRIISALKQLLNDKYLKVQISAAEALINLNHIEDERVIFALLQGVTTTRDTDSQKAASIEKRLVALGLLNTIYWSNPLVFPVLLELALETDGSSLREAALNALVERCASDWRIIAVLIEKLSITALPLPVSHDPVASCEQLNVENWITCHVIPALLRELEANHVSYERLIMQTLLVKFVPNDIRIIPALLATTRTKIVKNGIIQSRDEQWQMWVDWPYPLIIEALVNLCSNNAKAMITLLEEFNGTKVHDQYIIAIVLGKLGYNALRIIPALLELFIHKYANEAKQEASKALIHLLTPSLQHLKTLFLKGIPVAKKHSNVGEQEDVADVDDTKRDDSLILSQRALGRIPTPPEDLCYAPAMMSAELTTRLRTLFVGTAIPGIDSQESPHFK